MSARIKSTPPSNLLRWQEEITSDSLIEKVGVGIWKKVGLTEDPGTFFASLPIECAVKFRGAVPGFEIRPSLGYERDRHLTMYFELLLHWRTQNDYPMQLATRSADRGGWSDSRAAYAVAELKREAVLYAWQYYCAPEISTPRRDVRFNPKRKNKRKKNPTMRQIMRDAMK